MNQTVQPRHFRAARALNILINIIIAVLVILLAIFIIGGVWAHIDPNFGAELQDRLGDKPGTVPTISGLLAGGGLGGIIILSSYLYVALVVRAIVKTTVHGNPFVSENISRLRKTWIVIILAEIVRMIAMGVVQRSTAENSLADGNALEGFGVETSYQAWFLAFFIAIMAEVFRIGLELRRDQELTV